MPAVEASGYLGCHPSSSLSSVWCRICDRGNSSCSRAGVGTSPEQTEELPPAAGSTDPSLVERPYLQHQATKRMHAVLSANCTTSAYCQYPYRQPVLSTNHSGFTTAGKIGEKTSPPSFSLLLDSPVGQRSPSATHIHRPGAILMTPDRLHLPC